MILIEPEQLDIFCLEDAVWIATAPVNLPKYDFPFQTFFACRHPYYRPEQITAIGRFGVTTNYSDLYKGLKETGISLIHTPEQYLLASELTHWYPKLSDLTPRSVWFDLPPSAEEIERNFAYPVFIKGSRQTSKHQAKLSIVHSRKDYEYVAEQYKANPILHWQSFVCREFVELRSVSSTETNKIPPSVEFRTFWWYGQCVGAGSYWTEFATYSWTDAEKLAGLKIAQEVVLRLDVPFLVVDIAQTKDDKWIVIECNDAQESGYNGVAPIAIWQKIIDIEKARKQIV